MNFVIGYLQYDGRRSRFPSYIYYTIYIRLLVEISEELESFGKTNGSTYHFKRVSTCDPYDSFIIIFQTRARIHFRSIYLNFERQKKITNIYNYSLIDIIDRSLSRLQL